MKEDQKRVGRPVSIPAPWGDLAKAVGGPDELAKKLCVAYSTLHKWAYKVHRVPEMTLKEVRRLCKYHDVDCQL